MNRSAIISECGVYRYRLARWWGDGPRAVFIMLNPSTADGTVDDPTIRRCIGFARAWGLDGLEVVNLFALRSTDPDLLGTHPEPIGPFNDSAIRSAVDGAAVAVAAWGTNGALRGRGTAVRTMVGDRLQCFGRTYGGHPRHPLYVKASQALEPMAPTPEARP